jgi:hypothetical protein
MAKKIIDLTTLDDIDNSLRNVSELCNDNSLRNVSELCNDNSLRNVSELCNDNSKGCVRDSSNNFLGNMSEWNNDDPKATLKCIRDMTNDNNKANECLKYPQSPPTWLEPSNICPENLDVNRYVLTKNSIIDKQTHIIYDLLGRYVCHTSNI